MSNKGIPQDRVSKSNPGAGGIREQEFIFLIKSHFGKAFCISLLLLPTDASAKLSHESGVCVCLENVHGFIGNARHFFLKEEKRRGRRLASAQCHLSSGLLGPVTFAE